MSPWLDFRMPERRIWAMQTQKVGLRHNSNVLAHDWLPSFLRENQFRLLICVGLAPIEITFTIGQRSDHRETMHAAQKNQRWCT